jgi:hypothetical protein
MLRLKTLTAIMVIAMVMSLGAPQAFAGFMPTGVTADGPSETPGITGPQESPGATGGIEMPGLNGEIGAPGLNGEISTPGFAGWIGTGLATIASFFG